MRKTIIWFLLTIMGIAAPCFARDGITQEEMSTYAKLQGRDVISNEYTHVELNEPISKIDAMSMTIKAQKYLDKKKVNKSLLEKRLVNLGKVLADNDETLLGHLIDHDDRIIELDARAGRQEQLNYVLAGLLIVAIIL